MKAYTTKKRSSSLNTQKKAYLRVALVRHGKAPRITGKPDFARVLNDDGESQARKIGSRLAGQTFHFAVCSPADRTRQTVDIIAGSGADVQHKPVSVNSLFPKELAWLKMTDAFNRLEYSPLYTYYDDIVGVEELRLHARVSWQDVLEAVGLDQIDKIDKDKETNLLIVSHAVCMPALAEYLLEQTKASDQASLKMVRSANMLECCAIVVEFFTDGTATASYIDINAPTTDQSEVLDGTPAVAPPPAEQVAVTTT